MSPPRARRSSSPHTSGHSAGSGARDCFAIAAPGLEPLVAAELAALAALAPPPVREVRAVVGGVEFRADARGLAAAQVRLRVASRVLVRLANFRATAFHELERAARQVEWARVLGPSARFGLRVSCRKSRLYHSDAVAERVAAAIVRALPGARWIKGAGADDETEDTQAGVEGTTPAAADARAATEPTQLFVVRFDLDQCTISADASGELLHRRGYRLAVARAPMRETLAAALLLASGWDPRRPLHDPFCGSGTIPIEAALLARRIAPGLRRHFAAERWPDTPHGSYDEARAAAAAEVLPAAAAPIRGTDRDEGAIAAARANAERAGVSADVALECLPLTAVEASAEAGWIVTNPPYGVRVGDTARLRDLYAALGAQVRGPMRGWHLALVSADRALTGHMVLPHRVVATTNTGGIPVEFVVAP